MFSNMMKIDPFERKRRSMVKEQLMARNIRDPRTLDAMRRVPREKFVAEKYRVRAYDDCPLPIGADQTISQPYMVALMTEALQLKGTETVLEIGTGSGYQTAILAELAGQVFSIERLPALADKAEAVLWKLGYTNIAVLVGDGSMGDPDHAPFSAILVTAGSPEIPASLKEQLVEGGRLVIPVGSRGYQELFRVTRRGETFPVENLGGCVFVPLIGVQGWS
jgi:protein-L-isoaspartate(D-aspartate) O-methyltransferase